MNAYDITFAGPYSDITVTMHSCADESQACFWFHQVWGKDTLIKDIRPSDVFVE